MDLELPELPESEKEIRKDKLNTLIAITVTLIVAFMAMCKITDNNIVLRMQETQAAKVDHWSWYQSLGIREDIHQSKLADLRDDLLIEEDASLRKNIQTKIAGYEALTKKVADKKADVKEKAQEDEKHYTELNEVHERFDRSEAFISIAVSMLALTSLLQKRWMYAAALLPVVVGVFNGVQGLLG